MANVRFICPKCNSWNIKKLAERVWVCPKCKANVAYAKEVLVREHE